MKHLSAVLAVTAAAAASILAQATPAAPTMPPPTPLWSLSGDFQSPESAFYDAVTNSVFVSSINGGITEKDGNGYISRLTPDGKMVNAKWATGLNGPKGIRGVGGTLWVSDIDEVVGIAIASGQITSRVSVAGATFLNDLATAPDGTVYVSDSFGPAIYMVKDGRASVFVEGAETVEQVNGLLVDGSRLIAGSIGAAGGRGGPARGGGAPQGPPAGGRGAGGPPAQNQGAPPAPGQGATAARGAGRGGRAGGGAGGAGGSLFAFDLQTKARTKLTEEAVGGVDGIEPDGQGGVILTDVLGRRILQVRASGQTRVLAQLTGGGADIGFIPARNIVIVPYLNEHKVEAYDLTSALR
jgi:hypothetical protein